MSENGCLQYDMQLEILDAISCGVFAYTVPEHRLLIINDEAKRIIGCEGNDNPIKSILHFLKNKIVSEDRQTVYDIEKKLKKSGDTIEYSYRAFYNDDIIYLKVTVRLLKFPDGQDYVLCSMLDVTEQELKEKKLNKERSQYREALAIGSEAIFTVDLNEKLIKNDIISVKGVNLTGNLNIKMPTTYDNLASAWFASNRIITSSSDISIVRSRENLIKACKDGNSVIDIEYYTPSTGIYRRLLVLLYEVSGHTFANFVLYDITSDRSKEKEKRDIIGSLRKIYSALYHISLTEHTCTILKAHEDIADNLSECCDFDYFCNLYTENMIVDSWKQKVADFLNPDNIRRNLAHDDYVTIEFQRYSLGWCRITLVASNRNADGEVTSVLFAGNVIDSQKIAELQQQEALKAAYESANMANSAKTNFLANMSHDIRTPMNAIIGLTAIACTHIDDKEYVADCLSKITVSSKHLLNIINEVLDMSKIESGKMELQEDEFNLDELIDNLLMMSKTEMSAKNHEFSVLVRNIEHEKVFGDSQRIQQVFMNLMNNAIKYTPMGGKISLYISEKPTNRATVGCYEFIFEDNGIGMTEDYQKHIFEPFSRANDDSRVGKIQGTGLGMPITRNIVQMMNGNIKVESKLNKGTKITVTLFLRLRNDDENLSCEKLINLPVLVVDDDKISCIYTCQLLDEIGMQGEWVLSGREAIDSVIEHNNNGNNFFAVILDWKMPDMDGIETAKQIRKHIGEDMPIIIISAYDWTDIELEARKAGVNAFISKPLFKSRVLRLFNTIIGEENSEKEISDLDAISNEDFSGMRALLVEDNELNAEIAGEILGMAGLEVEFAVNGKQAVDIMSKVEDGYFDVVFMDIQMPVMNGYEAARAIRALSRNYTKSVPILAMTANAFAEDVTMAKNAGMNEHIAKPLDFGQLLKALRKWLR